MSYPPRGRTRVSEQRPLPVSLLRGGGASPGSASLLLLGSGRAPGQRAGADGFIRAVVLSTERTKRLAPPPCCVLMRGCVFEDRAERRCGAISLGDRKAAQLGSAEPRIVVSDGAFRMRTRLSSGFVRAERCGRSVLASRTEAEETSSLPTGDSPGTTDLQDKALE